MEKEPDYLPAIKQKYKLLLSYVKFSIHEIPSGILDGNIVSDEEALPVLLNNLEELSQLFQKLKIDNTKFINMCRIYYIAWKDYLKNKDKYKSCKQYLDKNKRKCVNEYR